MELVMQYLRCDSAFKEAERIYFSFNRTGNESFEELHRRIKDIHTWNRLREQREEQYRGISTRIS